MLRDRVTEPSSYFIRPRVKNVSLEARFLWRFCLVHSLLGDDPARSRTVERGRLSTSERAASVAQRGARAVNSGTTGRLPIRRDRSARDRGAQAGTWRPT